MEVVVMPSPWRRSHSEALVPGRELVAGHPEFFPREVIPVDPAAGWVSLPVASISEPHPGASLPAPLVRADLALLPGEEFVAGDPDVIAPVLVGLWGVPPTAVIGAVVNLVVGPGALLPDPVAVAVVLIMSG